MDEDLYNILKFNLDQVNQLHDDMKELNCSSDDFIEIRHRKEKDEDERLKDNIEWLKSIGVDISDEIELSQKAGSLKAESFLADIDEDSKKIKSRHLNYDELRDRAHKAGYIDSAISDILSPEEIHEAEMDLKRINNDFQEKTRLTSLDIGFLIVAVAMQVVRQYLLMPLMMNRPNASEGARLMEERYGKYGKMTGRYYYATEQTIIGQKKVPFDVIAGSKEKGIKNGKGLDGNSHRFYSLGHDPVLGYIFGTANIVTNTVTWWNGASNHIRYKKNRQGVSVPMIIENASTDKVFSYTVNRFREDNGKRIIMEAIVKEYLHLKSDMTTDGLPLPFLQMLSPDLAQELAEEGIDAVALLGIGKQAVFSELINYIISIVHSLICRESGEMEKKLYKVRTKKILIISNSIASSSNLIACGIGEGMQAMGLTQASLQRPLQYLDIGGLLVTIKHLFSDIKFINQLKFEYINDCLNSDIEDILREIEDRIY